MGFDLKYGVVDTEHGDIPDDEPVIGSAPATSRRSARSTALPEAVDQGGSSRRRQPGIIAENLVQCAARWQEGHPDRLKIPDRSAAALADGGEPPNPDEPCRSSRASRTTGTG